MQFFNPNSLWKQPFKPATNPSHTINMAQHGSKIGPKTIAQRLEINQSRKNPYLLKCSRSSNLQTILLGSTSSDCWNVNILRKKPPASFLFLSLFSFFFLFFLFSFFFLLSPFSPFLPFAYAITGCEPPYLYKIQNPCMFTHGLPCVLEGHAF